MRWDELTINTSYLASEAVATILHEFTDGFTISNTGRGLVYQAWLPEDNRLESRVEDLRQRFANLPAELLEDGEPTVERGWINEEDWAEAWKAYWHPLRLGRRLVIKPTWQPWPPPGQPELAREDDILIELDPGMAFGTGTHATTAQCLAALEDYLQPGARVIDLGSGSGILTVACLKLGASKVLAVDADPLSVQATNANCQLNRVSGCQAVEQRGLTGVEGQWDVVVANISYQIIKQEIPLVKERLKPGGLFISSGYFVGYEEEIVNQLQDTGFEILRSDEHEQWSCVTARLR